MIAAALPSRFLGVDGTLDGEALEDAFLTVCPKAEAHRWFFEDPIHDGGRTWVVSKMWGTNTVSGLSALVDLVPDAHVSCAPA